jgi:hypothetical protein
MACYSLMRTKRPTFYKTLFVPVIGHYSTELPNVQFLVLPSRLQSPDMLGSCGCLQFLVFVVYALPVNLLLKQTTWPRISCLSVNKPVFPCCRWSEACWRQHRRVLVDEVSSYVTLHITLPHYLLAVSTAEQDACVKRAVLQYVQIRCYTVLVENQYHISWLISIEYLLGICTIYRD